MTRRRTPLRDDRGSVTLELAILTPALILLLGLVALAGRVEGAARAVATETVQRELDAQGLRCAPSTVAVDTAGFDAPLGDPATVTVTTSCTVTMSDLDVPGLPGSRTLTGQATSPIDRYRTR